MISLDGPGTRTHRACRGAVVLARSGGAHPRHRRHDAAAEAQALRAAVKLDMIHGPSSLRFVVAAGLLVATTVTASVWTFFALTRLKRRGDRYRPAERIGHGGDVESSPAPSNGKTMLCCSILAGDERGTRCSPASARVVDERLPISSTCSDPDDERELATPLRDRAAGVSAGVRRRRLRRSGAGRAGAVPPEGEPGAAPRRRADHEHPRPPLRARAGGGRRCARPGRACAADRAAHHAGRARDCGPGGLAPDTHGGRAAAAVHAWRQCHPRGPLRRAHRIASRDELGELASCVQPDGRRPGRVPSDEHRRSRAGQEHLEATLEALPDAVVLLDAQLAGSSR